MFGWQFTVPVDLTEKERSAPPRPVDPDFPKYHPCHTNVPLTGSTSRSLLQGVARLRTPADINKHDVDRLNLQMSHEVPLEKLIPDGGGVGEKRVMHEEMLNAALNEIRISNDDAFLAILRIPTKEGEPKRPRLGNAHSFFQNLELMSHYWDSSKDNYYEIPDTTPQDEAPPPPPSMFVDTSNQGTAATKSVEEAGNGSGVVRMKEVYKGRRSNNGEAMPTDFLARTVKGFLDIPRMSFRIATYDRRTPAQLVVRNFKMPITLRYDMGLVPEDRKLARQERLEGPILGVHARAENKFKVGRGSAGEASQAEIADCYREIGALLLLAQKRARAGRTEVLPGQEQWWGRKRRWGGGVGGHMPHESDEEPTEDPSKPKPESIMPKQSEHEDGDASSPTALAAASSSQQPIPSRPIPSDLKRTAPDSHDGPNDDNRNHHGSASGRKRRSPPTDPKPSGASDSKADDAETLLLLKKKRALGPRAKALLHSYRSLKPAARLWDEHIEYRAIGRRPRRSDSHGRDSASGNADGDGFDDVYLVSAVNCHLSFLHLRVHSAYMRWLEEGADVPAHLPPPPPPRADAAPGGRGEEGPDTRPDTLYVQRSRWFNLFEVEDRAEALGGLWRVLSWICREDAPEES